VPFNKKIHDTIDKIFLDLQLLSNNINYIEEFYRIIKNIFSITILA